MKDYDFLEVRRLGNLKREYLKEFKKLIGCGACGFLFLETRYCENLDSVIHGPLNLRSCLDWKRRE